jgi:hypothetical protein
MPGDVARRGDTEKREPLSETRDGAPSTDSALDASDTDGEGSGECLEEYAADEIVRGLLVAGLAYESCWERSSKLPH